MKKSNKNVNDGVEPGSGGLEPRSGSLEPGSGGLEPRSGGLLRGSGGLVLFLAIVGDEGTSLWTVGPSTKEIWSCAKDCGDNPHGVCMRYLQTTVSHDCYLSPAGPACVGHGSGLWDEYTDGGGMQYNPAVKVVAVHG